MSVLLFGGVFLFASSCSEDGGIIPPPTAPNTPNSVVFTQPGLYPEGVQYGKNKRYFVSSLTRGAIGQVQDNGNYRVFADDARLVSTIGLNLDESRNRLLAAVSDPGVNTVHGRYGGPAGRTGYF